MGVKVVRELLRRNPGLEPGVIGDVILAATAQVGDQGLRSAATSRCSLESLTASPASPSTACVLAR
jgi:hypothetical protein